MLKSDAKVWLNFYQHARVESFLPLLIKELGLETILLTVDALHLYARDSLTVCFGKELKLLFLETKEHNLQYLFSIFQLYQKL